MPWPESIELSSNYCTLLPLQTDHTHSLIEAVSDGELWKLEHTLVPHPDEMKNEIARRKNFFFNRLLNTINNK